MVSPEPHSFRRKSHPHVTLHLRHYSTVTAERPELGIYALTSTCQAECISTLRHCQHLVPEQRRSWASPSGASGSGNGPQAPGNSVTPQEVEVLSDQLQVDTASLFLCGAEGRTQGLTHDANANRTKGMRPAQVWWDLSWRLLGPEGPETFPACTIPLKVLTRGLNFTTLHRAAACSCT
ncbi:uncharacterized protein LOC107153100 [Marmota marmota marmota]|uniref:uncharacterized protein LOC107153100 n=1 Tax=Marmota marmota marmota TaxID=9994 RepID=UPI0020923ACE|nr:uncharacterized protein LOC107153100 [Marmota marmota marmota]